jgi:hypothetical protein
MGEIKMQNLPGVEQKFNPVESKTIKMSDLKDFGSRRATEFMKIMHRGIKDVFRKDQWAGKRCFIIGGGPSVKNFDLKKLEGEHTIGINMAFRLFNPEIIFGMDARLWGWIEEEETGKGDREKFNKCKSIKVWSDITQAPLPEDIVIAPSIGRPGLSESLEEGLGIGTNSGFGALNLALLLGASEIYLIGYDFKGGRWHPGYPAPSEAGNDYHLQCFLENSEGFKKFPSKIINLNSDSALKIFEFGKLPANLKEEKAPPAKTEEVIARKKSETDPVFVNYYTVGNGYEEFAKTLQASMRRFDLEFDSQPIKDRGKWDINTKFKPEFILKMMEKYPERPIVWVDADAVFVKCPELLFNIEEDIAVHYYKEGRELVSNLVYFAPTKKAEKILNKWKEACEDPEKEAVWDQQILQKILESNSKSVKVNRLPPEYCYILLGKNPAGIDPVVEQRQASRSLKK